MTRKAKLAVRSQKSGVRSQPSLRQIKTALNKFTGQIKQIPPQHSAVHVGGQRAYKLARAGKVFELTPRPVAIHELKLQRYLYPKLEFNAKVSSGTYIRSLARDLGEELGTGAYLSALRRTSIGEFSAEQGMAMDSASREILDKHLINSQD